MSDYLALSNPRIYFAFYNNAPQSKDVTVNNKREIFSFWPIQADAGARQLRCVPSSKLMRPLRQFHICIIHLVLACTVWDFRHWRSLSDEKIYANQILCKQCVSKETHQTLLHSASIHYVKPKYYFATNSFDIKRKQKIKEVHKSSNTLFSFKYLRLDSVVLPVSRACFVQIW